jgi:hypothetical protein
MITAIQALHPGRLALLWFAAALAIGALVAVDIGARGTLDNAERNYARSSEQLAKMKLQLMDASLDSVEPLVRSVRSDIAHFNAPIDQRKTFFDTIFGGSAGLLLLIMTGATWTWASSAGVARRRRHFR